jgi:hypothetical protein
MACGPQTLIASALDPAPATASRRSRPRSGRPSQSEVANRRADGVGLAFFSSTSGDDGETVLGEISSDELRDEGPDEPAGPPAFSLRMATGSVLRVTKIWRSMLSEAGHSRMSCARRAAIQSIWSGGAARQGDESAGRSIRVP